MSSEALSGPKALGAFLRAHRERITPEMLGLPSSSRRRTGGLRREELAQISGISATVYRIEQGREVSISLYAGTHRQGAAARPRRTPLPVYHGARRRSRAGNAPRNRQRRGAAKRAPDDGALLPAGRDGTSSHGTRRRRRCSAAGWMWPTALTCCTSCSSTRWRNAGQRLGRTCPPRGGRIPRRNQPSSKHRRDARLRAQHDAQQRGL